MRTLMSKLRASLAPLAGRGAGLALGVVASASLLAGAAQAEPAVWVVKDKDSTIYLVGTVHLLKADTDWRTAKIEKAMADSKELWLEIAELDDPAAAAPLIQKLGLDFAKPLSSKLSAEQNAKMKAVADKYGLPVAQLQPMKPWLAALTFSLAPIQAAGFDPNAGVDRQLKAQAVKEGDAIKAFETVEEQIGFFADLPEADQIAYLEQALDEADKGAALLNQLADAWAAGDVDSIAKVMNDEMKAESPAFYDRLLTQRNMRWAGRIEQMLQGSGTHLIAVGAGHLAGADSVQAQLAKRGIKAERL